MAISFQWMQTGETVKEFLSDTTEKEFRVRRIELRKEKWHDCTEVKI